MCKSELKNLKGEIKMFNDKTLLITGGTGSFGHAVLNRFINDFKEIRIFSRDEKKQDDMRQDSRWDSWDDLIL